MLPDTITIRPLAEGDLADANRVFRLAFGTWLKVPDPMQFAGDSSWVEPRFRGRLGGAHAALVGDRLIGSNLTANRGSLGFFGPLTVDPDWWGKRVAQALVVAAVEDFERWGVEHGGLCTFPESVLHIGLYRKFGFWPGQLTAGLVKQLTPAVERPANALSYATAPADTRASLERDADAICGSILGGLTVMPELRAVLDQQLGDTVFVAGDAVDGFAVCHCGPGTEAGTGNCRVKFAAARSAGAFDRLVDAWESLARSRGTPKIQVGVNFGRERAVRALLQRGYSTVRTVVAMHRPNDPAYDRADAWVVDDWR